MVKFLKKLNLNHHPLVFPTIRHLSYMKGAHGKLRYMNKSRKITPTFDSKLALYKFLYKPKDLATTEENNKVVYEHDCLTGK